MGIKKYSGYIVECDNCHEIITHDGQGIEIYDNKQTAKDTAKQLDFILIGNSVYCPKCAEYL